MVQLLGVEPKDLTFQVEPRKQASCTLRLSNNTQFDVAYAFKVKSTSSGKYAVQPKEGIVYARSTFRMQGPKESISGIECKDKFLIMNHVVARDETTTENFWELSREPVTRDAGDDIKLRVRYVIRQPQTGPSNYERARADAQVYELQERRLSPQEVRPREGHNGVPDGDLFYKVVKYGLLGLAVWFLVTKILSIIWSLAFLVIMLVIKIVNRLVSDSVEEWTLKILCYMVLHFISTLFSTLFRRNETTPEA